ncbi:protein FREE1-like isoform X2 [Phalaenopsis equestris]|uniref:protein FREE1-like isoform X2 n=1 Tax=Phalaenopsis equestris TaxID=78828 RepID=UPI0009E2C5BD|nr:protein FREE1-like isoform X2 [Phalaenopsis equestris]
MQRGNDFTVNSPYSFMYPHSYPSPNESPHSHQSQPSSASAPPHPHFPPPDISASYPQLLETAPNPQPAPYPHLLPHLPYDPRHPSFNYVAHLIPNSNQNPSFVSSYPLIENPYQGAGDHVVDCFYGKKLENDFGYNEFGEGVYAYDGGRVEPYDSQRKGPIWSSSSSSWSGFDDYGRSVGFASSGREQVGGLGKVVRAEPKADMQHDVKCGVQKFRVKLLSEGAGQSNFDILCQVGLDGIHMLDPSSNRTLRIYPLENLTRWEIMDSSIFVFWAKSSVDPESRRVRLQSNSYTSNTMLDSVTAAIAQLKEMGGTSESSKQTEQLTEKKRGFGDWMNLIKPHYEEKDHWVPDEAVGKCTSCGISFGAFVRREEVTRRLNIAKESVGTSSGFNTHEALARKLQEEMEKKRRRLADSKSLSVGFSRRMREVACPTCTVLLQVQVPTSGSETIECGVCQHPFLVSSN